MIVAILTITNTSRALAEESPDFQLRVPVHLQYFGLHTNTAGNFGLAAWNIFADVTAPRNETATFSAFGPLWQYDTKGSWIEIMAGFRRNEDGYVDPALDIRLSDRTFRRLGLFAELAYFPKEERRRVYAYLAADTPVQLGSYAVRVGFESESILSLAGKHDSLGIGPRLVLPLPFVSRISPHLSSSISIGYQYRTDQDFVRCYVGCTYVFGRKK